MSRNASGWMPSPVAAVPQASDEESAEGDRVHAHQEDEDRLIAEALSGDLEVPLDAQQCAEAEASKWAKEWQVGECPPMPVWPASLGEAMPVPCVDAPSGRA